MQASRASQSTEIELLLYVQIQGRFLKVWIIRKVKKTFQKPEEIPVCWMTCNR